jgi:Flp pilus assembly protein, ATPase CpaF
MARKKELVIPPDEMSIKIGTLRTLIDLMDEKPPLGINYEKHLKDLINEAFSKQQVILGNEETVKFLEDIYLYVTSFHEIESLLNDPQVSEIMINGFDCIYKEVCGEIILTNIKFENDIQVRFLINHIINPLGRYINYKVPMVDAHLPDGSRINAVIPPIVKQGSVLSIRKFLKDIFNLEELLGLGSISENMAKFLKICVQARLNILVGGNTSSGKTTLLNILAGSISDKERIITIEDSLELQLPQPHVLSLEARPADNQGEGLVSMRDLVRNVVRMRPDRIIVGEVRGPEALDMLQAMNTGHDGSMVTIHANSARQALSRLETMVMMAGLDMPLNAIRKQMASALDLIVYLSRFPDGTRKVTQITEVVGMDTDIISLTDLFLFNQSGVNEKSQPVGSFRSTGLRPMFDRKINNFGLSLPPELLHA